MAKILLIDDDSTLLDGLKHLLSVEGHSADSAESLGDAKYLLENFDYDLLIVDWNLPDGSGPNLIAGLRNRKHAGPILMLTANDGLREKEHGFESGADDYLCKPFEPRELRVRVNALLRRMEKTYQDKLSVGNLTIDLAKQAVSIAGEDLVLQNREYQILQLLAKNEGAFFSNEALLKRLWPSETESGIETVRTTVYKLRKKISDSKCTHHIETQYKTGYRLALRKTG